MQETAFTDPEAESFAATQKLEALDIEAEGQRALAAAGDAVATQDQDRISVRAIDNSELLLFDMQ